MTSSIDSTLSAQQHITALFGLYRAEWMNGHLFDLFTEPQYFGQLKTARPCALIGGRGTGKTTVLKGLSYEGQLALKPAGGDPVERWKFIGLYYRADTNRVAAFSGQDLTEDRWIRCFGHYINLQFCALLLEFLEWYERATLSRIRISENSLRRVCTSLNISACSSPAELAEALYLAMLSFEASINNVGDAFPNNLSLQKAPIDELVDALHETPQLRDRHFAFLLDEFENFSDYQQRVVNTIMKHANPKYSIIVGVRELGWRTRATLNPNEQLSHPADYERIDIVQDFAGAQFAEFAQRVCNGRLAQSQAVQLSNRIQDALPSLSLDEEAVSLGCESDNATFLEAIQSRGEATALAFAREQRPAMLNLMRAWSEWHKIPPIDVIREAMTNRSKWDDRYTNYAHAMLFVIRRGRRGLRKYYAGWDVFLLLANGNIRFLLELVHQSLLKHFSGPNPASSVSAQAQTEAAQHVGRKYLAELEGIASEGGRLTKLVLGFGRVFQVLAEHPEGHSPELNQFCLVDKDRTAPVTVDVEALLRLAIMHLALVRTAGTKQIDEADTLEFDYMLHPIFAPFFEYSHRRKRKLEVASEDIMTLLVNPSAGIKKLLGAKATHAGGALPDQLMLFEGFYRGDN